MDLDFKNSAARWYFYITPGFILLDYTMGINVRISALDTMPFYKNLYYGFCILCGICMYIIPRYSAVVALLESSINIILLVLGIYLPYIRIVTALMDDALGADFTALQESFKVQPIVNLFIVSSCLILTLEKSFKTIAESFGHDKQASKNKQN